MRPLERDHLLSVLADQARSAAAGTGGVVLVAGEAGVGKTALLRAFAAGARAVPVLWGMCDSLSTPRPLGPLRDIAAELGPELPGVLRGAVAQHEVFAAVLEVLRARPRVLVMEDLHWADEATLDLVRFLARRVASLPVSLVVSYRDPLPVDHPLSAVLGDLVSAAAARRIQLTPLSLSAVAHLVDEHGLDAADVLRRTGGNPFFVSQIVAQPHSPLPENVRDAVLARLAGLDPAARHILELLSCSPEPVSGDVLQALGMSPMTVAGLAATGLIDRRGHRVEFRHEIARSAVLGAAAPGTEPALHAEMVAALETVDGDVSALAHHAAAAGDVDRVLRYAPAAAAEASRSGAHREAVAFFESALAVAGPDRAELRASLLESISLDLYLTDRLREAIRAREQAVELWRDLGRPVAVGVGHTALAGYAWYAADRALAEKHSAAAIAILDGAGDPRALGFALAREGFLAAWRGDAGEALASTARVAEIAAELGGDPVLGGTAAVGSSIARLTVGDLGGRADLRAAAEVGLRHRLDDLATTPMSNLCSFDVEQGRLTDAEASVAEALRISEERDTPICTAYQLGVRARLRLLQGRWADAEQDARTVLRSGDLPLSQLFPHLVLGLLLARREAPHTNPHLDELWRLVHRLDSPSCVAAAASALLENAWITRRPDDRLADPLVADLCARPFSGRDGVVAPVAQWARRLADAGVQRLVVAAAEPAPAGADRPYEQALLGWDRGSNDDLLAALPVLDGLGAKPVAAVLRARLRAAGVSSVPRGRLPGTRANPGGLTDRQLDVLALLVEGLSNARIAERLVIAPKTADHHVSAILARLGVASRAEAAVAARRLGIGAERPVTRT